MKLSLTLVVLLTVMAGPLEGNAPSLQLDAVGVLLRQVERIVAKGDAAAYFVLTVSQGSVFVVQTNQGVTGLVLLGRGNVQFHPASETERGQVKIFCGSEMLESRFDGAFVRMNPADFDAHVTADRLTPRPVDP